VPKLATKAPELNYNPTEAESSHFVLISGGDEDTVVLTPEEKDKILKDVPEEEQQDEDENED
jgi:predicted double-glycine peptidase